MSLPCGGRDGRPGPGDSTNVIIWQEARVQSLLPLRHLKEVTDGCPTQEVRPAYVIIAAFYWLCIHLQNRTNVSQ